MIGLGAFLTRGGQARSLPLVLVALILAVPAPAQEPDQEPAPEPEQTGSTGAAANTDQTYCELIEEAAAEHGLPVPFFTRLLWKESRFRTDAVSPKGAQGIAQFMPGTAEERGLLDPFDPLQAIPASAHLLADLNARFGNLGLAAAAYNGGAQRVESWLAGTGSLPWETVDFVLSITGVPAASWASAEPLPEPPADPDAPQDCLALAALLKVPGNEIASGVATASGPWGVQVAGNFSRAHALSAYSALQQRHAAILGGRDPMVIGTRIRGRGVSPFYRIRIPMQTRDSAEELCRGLKSAGGTCIVLKN